MRRRVGADDLIQAHSLMHGREESGAWEVCDDYEIRGGEVVAKFDPQDLDRWAVYHPLEEAPDLFLKFARLHKHPRFEDAALAFSRKYGIFGGATGASTLEQSEQVLPSRRMSLSRFRDESKRAWAVLTLYESSLNQDAETAETLIYEYRDDEVLQECLEYLYIKPGITEVSVTDGDRDQLSARLSEGAGLRALDCALVSSVSAVQETVRKLCRQEIGFGVITFGMDNSRKLDPSRVKARWVFDSLLGAMYLQMYWLMTSGGELTRCEYCGRIISLARPHPEGRKRRQDKRFCDDACRQAHHRSKKKRQASGY